MDLLSIPYLVQHLCSLIVAHLTELAQARRYLGLRAGREIINIILFTSVYFSSRQRMVGSVFA